jgi:hypothetical protein
MAPSLQINLTTFQVSTTLLQIYVLVIHAMVLLFRDFVIIQSLVHGWKLLFLRPFPFEASLYLPVEKY